jgi:hypothetical protein
MKKIFLFLSAIALMVSCVNKEEAQKEATERILQEAKPCIEHMKKLDGLIKKYGVKEPYLHATADINDKNLLRILPLLKRDMSFFDETSKKENYNTRYKDVNYSGSFRDLLFLDCNELVNHDGDTIHYEVTDLAKIEIGSYLQNIYDDEDKDYFLSEEEAREFVEEKIKVWDGKDTTSYDYYAALYPVKNMEQRQNEYNYVAFLKTLYRVEPVSHGDDSFEAGFLARHVSVYHIDSGELKAEFDVYATNSDRAIGLGSADPALSDLRYNYIHELFYLLNKAGFKYINN